MSSIPTFNRRTLAALALAGAVIRPGRALAALGDVAEYGPMDHLQTVIRPIGAQFVPDARAASFRYIGLDKRRDAILYTPKDVDWSKPVPLVLVMHGKNGAATDAMPWFKSYANEHKFLILSVPSRGSTWGYEAGGIGADAAFIDRCLDWVASRFPLDPARLGVAGYSDGASFALCMGLQNGDVFSHVMAFEAVSFTAPDARGKPKFFFSHGRMDEGTSLSNCLQMVKQLKDLGYDVSLDVHPKGHIVADQGVRAAVAQFLA